jgi:hypothetical protein
MNETPDRLIYAKLQGSEAEASYWRAAAREHLETAKDLEEHSPEDLDGDTPSESARAYLAILVNCIGDYRMATEPAFAKAMEETGGVMALSDEVADILLKEYASGMGYLPEWH